MNRFLPIAAIAAALSLAPGSHANALTIKLCTLAPEGSPWYDVLRDMTEAWKAESNGKIRFRIYPRGCGDEPVIIRKMRVGQVHAAGLTGAGLAQIAKDFMGLQMPMMFRSYDELNHVRDRLTPKLESLLERKGFKLLTWGDAGWVHFFTRTPVKHPDDLKRMRIWTWAGDPATAEAWKQSGYNPVPLPATEIYTGLASGLVDTFSATPVAALSFQWFGLAKNMTDLKWAPLTGAVIISLRTWKKVPADMRPRLLEIARKAGQRLNGMLPDLRAKAITVMKKHGLTVHEVPGPALAEWERRARKGYPALIGKLVPAETVAEVEKIRNAYRAQRKK